MGRSTDASRRWAAAVAARPPNMDPVQREDPYVDSDFELATKDGPVRFRVCSRRGDSLRCMMQASQAFIPVKLLEDALAAGTVRRVVCS